MNIYKTNKYWPLILLFLSSLFFYMPFGLESNQILKAIFYISVVILILIFKERFKIEMIDKSFDKYLIWMALSFFISIFSSAIYRDQPISIGIISTLPYFTYLLFFAFRRCRVSFHSVEFGIKIMGSVSACIMFVDLITFPEIFFGSADYDFTRGGLRIRLPGIDWIILFFFYSLYKVLSGERKYIYIVSALIMYVAIILSLTRQIIIVTTVLALGLYIFKMKSIHKFIIAVCVVFSIILFLKEIPIISSLIDITEEQIYSNRHEKDDVRVNAWNFFVDTAQANDLTKIIGNGMYSEGNSIYGNKMAKIQSDTYCYLTDVGWASFYFLFGIVGLIPLIIIFLKSYLKIFDGGISIPFVLYLIFAGVTSFTSGVILYQYQIIVIALSLYTLTIITSQNNKKW